MDPHFGDPGPPYPIVWDNAASDNVTFDAVSGLVTVSNITLKGAVGVLSFKDFAPGSFILTINNWTGEQELQGTSATDRLIFNASQAANLNQFTFDGFGAGAREIALGNGYFEIVAVPEPSTALFAGMALFGLAASRRRR